MKESPPTGEWDGLAAATGRPVVPGYNLLDELGRGGMGIVYRARHVATGVIVALKVIRDAALAGPAARARFRIEADAAARMRHPNIVPVLDIGEAGGYPFLAMEFVAGGSLDQHLGGRPQPVEDAARLVRTLALAVAHAHARQVVHRDLKPANVLLQIEDLRSVIDDWKTGDPPPKSPIINLQSPIVPKITDFGLAKRLDSDSTAWTLAGAVLGTPAYMAPEQAAGRTDAIGPAADVYALGVILYEMLVGRPPFAGDSRDRLIQQVLRDDPPPPSRVRADVPRALETVCLKCLEKEPERRYATARELADDLERFLDGRPVAAMPVGDGERVRRQAERDGFRFVGEVGRGRWSVVHQVRHESSARPLALKVYAAGRGTRDEWEARLRRCGELSVSLAHPQVVPVVRGGWWDESAFVVTGCAPLGSLAGRLDGRPQPVRQAVELVERLAELVRYLHRQGVVHGNLKPSNVLLAADDLPQIIDFRPTAGHSLGPLPTDGEPAGLGYLAPEVVANPAAELHPPADVYGLGLILYEMLAGRPAFEGATAADILERVQFQDEVPPSSLNPAVPPMLDWVCRRCLRKNPWQRFGRVYDLVARLRQAQEPGH